MHIHKRICKDQVNISLKFWNLLQCAVRPLCSNHLQVRIMWYFILCTCVQLALKLKSMCCEKWFYFIPEHMSTYTTRIFIGIQWSENKTQCLSFWCHLTISTCGQYLIRDKKINKNRWLGLFNTIQAANMKCANLPKAEYSRCLQFSE